MARATVRYASISPLASLQGRLIFTAFCFVGIVNLVFMVLLSRESFRQEFNRNPRLSLPILGVMVISDLLIAVLSIGLLSRVIRI